MRVDRLLRSMLPALAVSLLALVWLTPPSSLATWFRHPRRVDADAFAVQAAWAARLGWTLGACTLALMPWTLRDRRAEGAPAARPRSIWLWIAMALAVTLRFSNATQGLWYDEIASLGGYVAHGPGVIVGNAFTTANHPLQSLASWCCLPLGVEPWIRLPSMLSGAVAVLGCWLVGRAVSEGTRVATVMAFTMAILPAAVNAGSEARGYGLMIASSALSTGLLLAAMRRAASWRWVTYALVLALGVWAHFVTAMVGAGHALFALTQLPRKDRRVEARGTLLAVACAALLALALWSPALPDLLRSRAQFGAHRGDEPSLADTQGLLLLWQVVGMTPLPLRTSGVDAPWAVLTAIPAAGLLLLGAFESVRDRRLRQATALTGLGLPMAIAAAWLGGSWLYARFLLFAAPATALLLAAGFERLMRADAKHAPGAARAPTRRAPTARLGLAVAGLVACVFLGYDLLAGPRQPIREAVAQVASRRETSDRVLGIGIADDVVQWYAMAFDVPVEPTGVGGERLREALARADARWIVALYPRHRHADASAHALAQFGFLRRPAHGLPGWLDGGEGTVEIWERPPRSP